MQECSLDALLILQGYAVLSHGAASLGKKRPHSQRTRWTNTKGTTLDLITYIATFNYLYTVSPFTAKNVILGVIGFGALAHLVYVSFQLISDRWYRDWIDDYTQESITHGPLLNMKMIAAKFDMLFHLAGLATTILISPLALYSVLASASLAYLLFNIAWQQPHKHA